MKFALGLLFLVGAAMAVPSHAEANSKGQVAIGRGVACIIHGGPHDGITAGGTLQCWSGAGPFVPTGMGSDVLSIALSTTSQVGGATDTFCAIQKTATGTLLSCWGANGNGQTGRFCSHSGAIPNRADYCTNGTLYYNSPGPAINVGASGTGVTQVVNTGDGFCAIVDGGLGGAGHVQCWGDNHFNQIGDGSPDIDVHEYGSGVTGLPANYLANELVSLDDGACARVSQSSGTNGLYCWGDAFGLHAPSRILPSADGQANPLTAVLPIEGASSAVCMVSPTNSGLYCQGSFYGFHDYGSQLVYAGVGGITWLSTNNGSQSIGMGSGNPGMAMIGSNYYGQMAVGTQGTYGAVVGNFPYLDYNVNGVPAYMTCSPGTYASSAYASMCMGRSDSGSQANRWYAWGIAHGPFGWDSASNVTRVPAFPTDRSLSGLIGF
jgi:hypothetical protein